MTPEKIKALREIAELQLASMPVYTDTGPMPGTRVSEIMLRLIDEREALLDALRDMLTCLEAHSFEEDESYIQRAQAAIAKAEAP